jgi:hypothetical protein
MDQSDKRVVVDQNRHIHDYLTYYLNIPHPPHYAVLLNGAWGIGKTFLLKKFLKEFFEDESSYVYVSLYGLSRIDDIDEALFQAIYPVLGWKSTKLTGRAVKAALKFFKIEPDIKITDVLSKAGEKVYIFDDLERTSLPIDSVLGYINAFVEHDGCKVIIVANENEISEAARYRQRREKLIGKTLEVQSTFEEALDHFTSLIQDSPTKALFIEKRSEISAIYGQSGLSNLRILQQTMWDFERLFRTLSETHRKNDQAVTVLLRLIFALSFELKAGRIHPGDIDSRLSKIVEGMMAERDNASITDLRAADSRYPQIELNHDILPDALLNDILIKGIVDEEAIRTALDRGSYFAVPGEEPAWRVLWYGLERTEVEFDRALAELEQQFVQRAFVVIGEVLHVFGLRLWLADVGLLSRSVEQVVAEAKQYVDDIYAQGRLETARASFADVRFTGYDRLAFHHSDTEAFRELFAYLDQKQQAAREDLYPIQADALLKEMEADSDLFFKRLNVTNSEENLYYDVPILASIKPDAFVSALLRLHPRDQRAVFMALKSRYEHGELNRRLEAERPWLRIVRRELLAAAEHLGPVGKYRISKNVEWNMQAALEGAD